MTQGHAAGRNRLYYEYVYGGIHEFTFNEASPAALKEWLGHLQGIYSGSFHARSLRFLLDTRPFSELPANIRWAGRWNLPRAQRQHPPTHIALLHTPHAMVETLLRALPLDQGDRLRLFPLEARGEALDWLRLMDQQLRV